MSTILIPQWLPLYFHFPGAILLNDVFPIPAKYDGQILGWFGSIPVLGSGAGTSTDFQLYNDTTGEAYFLVPPTFEVDAASNVLEGGRIVNAPVFKAGQVLRGKIVAVSTNPADAVIGLFVKMYEPVTV